MNTQLISIVLLVTLVGMALAGCHGHLAWNANQDEARMLRHLSGELELTPVQESAIAPLVVECLALKRQLTAQQSAWYAHSAAQLAAEVPVAGESARFAEEQIRQFAKLVDRYQANLQRVKAILTSEQREKLVALLAKHKGRRHGA